MKYETPELTASTPAINAIQSISKVQTVTHDSPLDPTEPSAAYADWED